MNGFKYPIGTKYTVKSRLAMRHCEVVDHYTTLNSAGEVVRRRYVAQHMLGSRRVLDLDVVETTIARALYEAP